MAKAAVIMGSDSDLKIMNETVKVLEKFGIETKVSVASAHRTPEKVEKLVESREKEGVEVIIAGAGMAAHLAGVITAKTTLPVIAVPMPGGALNGVDALYSMVQMPKGVPVGCMAIGKAGAINAGVFAAEILGIKYEDIKKKLAAYKVKMAEDVEKKDAELQEKGVEKFLKDNA
ncbi:MAG TPA: 5-(carboxyamino)imidazole ribonucleotide mutase [Firmicutes bacterium]|nr:5-(carboxyamino)imidazole ribonucleotide mutase [Bacillota bacterium]